MRLTLQTISACTWNSRIILSLPVSCISSVWSSLTHSFLTRNLSIDPSRSHRPLRSRTLYPTLFSFQLVQRPKYLWVLHVQLVADVLALNVAENKIALCAGLTFCKLFVCSCVFVKFRPAKILPACGRGTCHHHWVLRPCASTPSLSCWICPYCSWSVCLLGWVIESNSHRSVTSVSLSFPQPDNMSYFSMRFSSVGVWARFLTVLDLLISGTSKNYWVYSYIRGNLPLGSGNWSLSHFLLWTDNFLFCNRIKKRRRPRVKKVTLKLWRVRKNGKTLR